MSNFYNAAVASVFGSQNMTVSECMLFIRNHVVSAVDNGNRTLTVNCDTTYSANRAVGVYAKLFYVTGDAEMHFLNTNKKAYPKFKDSAERDKARILTEKLLGDGPVTYQGVTISGSAESNNETVTVTDPLEDDLEELDTEKKTDWTTYIIIGAAAAVILLLLWDRKKK